jgi:hypothetical protein
MAFGSNSLSSKVALPANLACVQDAFADSDEKGRLVVTPRTFGQAAEELCGDRVRPQRDGVPEVTKEMRYNPTYKIVGTN